VSNVINGSVSDPSSIHTHHVLTKEGDRNSAEGKEDVHHCAGHRALLSKFFPICWVQGMRLVFHILVLGMWCPGPTLHSELELEVITFVCRRCASGVHTQGR
jgi:hypothetical protein